MCDCRYICQHPAPCLAHSRGSTQISFSLFPVRLQLRSGHTPTGTFKGCLKHQQRRSIKNDDKHVLTVCYIFLKNHHSSHCGETPNFIRLPSTYFTVCALNCLSSNWWGRWWGDIIFSALGPSGLRVLIQASPGLACAKETGKAMSPRLPCLRRPCDYACDHLGESYYTGESQGWRESAATPGDSAVPSSELSSAWPPQGSFSSGTSPPFPLDPGPA